jgi:hypothetical protein
MRYILLVALAFCVLAGLTTIGASASPSATGLRVAGPRALVTEVDYQWHHNRYHHRHWAHGHYRYY